MLFTHEGFTLSVEPAPHREEGQSTQFGDKLLFFTLTTAWGQTMSYEVSREPLMVSSFIYYRSSCCQADPGYIGIERKPICLSCRSLLPVEDFEVAILTPESVRTENDEAIEDASMAICHEWIYTATDPFVAAVEAPAFYRAVAALAEKFDDLFALSDAYLKA